MSTEQNNHLSSNYENYTEDEYLPPRSMKHGRRRPELEEEEVETEDLRQKSFPFLQIVMWSLLSIILFMIVFGLWEHYKANPKQPENVAEETNQNNSQNATDNEDELVEEESNSDDTENHVEDEVNNTDKERSPTPSEDGNSEIQQPKVIKEHVVQPGETFYRITMKYYNSRAYEDYLADFNGIKDKTDIKAGTIIKIPEAR